MIAASSRCRWQRRGASARLRTRRTTADFPKWNKEAPSETSRGLPALRSSEGSESVNRQPNSNSACGACEASSIVCAFAHGPRAPQAGHPPDRPPFSATKKPWPPPQPLPLAAARFLCAGAREARDWSRRRAKRRFLRPGAHEADGCSLSDVETDVPEGTLPRARRAPIVRAAWRRRESAAQIQMRLRRLRGQPRAPQAGHPPDRPPFSTTKKPWLPPAAAAAGSGEVPLRGCERGGRLPPFRGRK